MMSKNNYLYQLSSFVALAVIALFLFAPVSASAETVLRISDSISLAADQTVEDDFYGIAGLYGPVSLSGSVEGDAYVFGSSVTINGPVDGDLAAAWGAVQVHASVTDDVRIFGGEVTIAEYVGGDVFVYGGSLNVLSSAEIAGDVFYYDILNGAAEINGTVGGSIFGNMHSLRVDGAVGGSIDVVVDELVLGERADVTENVTYTSAADLVRAQNAVVAGEIIRNDAPVIPVNTREALVPLLMYAF
ncbi:hypothetical protein N9L26_02590, partial [Candidatus Pacebacteria bacterium]|nr:hypothetical protein [Candidatus Paceibacterota bacterium]